MMRIPAHFVALAIAASVCFARLERSGGVRDEPTAIQAFASIHHLARRASRRTKQPWELYHDRLYAELQRRASARARSTKITLDERCWARFMT
jgi:hypothetical protein